MGYPQGVHNLAKSCGKPDSDCKSPLLKVKQNMTDLVRKRARELVPKPLSHKEFGNSNEINVR